MDPLYNRLRNPSMYYLYDNAFIDFLEMNLAELRQNSVAKSMEIKVSDVDRARADRNFNLLCNIAQIPFDLHWVTLRVNNYKEYSEFRAKDTPLYQVDTEYLAMLKLKFDESQTNN